MTAASQLTQGIVMFNSTHMTTTCVLASFYSYAHVVEPLNMTIRHMMKIEQCYLPVS